MGLSCQLCGKPDVILELTLNNMHVAHHFGCDLRGHAFSHALSIGQCDSCSLIQLTSRFPIAELVPKYNWITCTEPEGHLDSLVSELITLDGINEQSSIVGLSFKEESTLARFNNKGFKQTRIVDPALDMDIAEKNTMIELVQYKFDEDFSHDFVSKYGKVDVFIARHILEHAYNPNQFLAAAKNLIKDDGYFVIEIPDCWPGLELGDPTVLWEEHTIFFTEESLKRTLQFHSLDIVSLKKVNYKYENAIVAVVKKKPSSQRSSSNTKKDRFVVGQNEARLLRVFSENFSRNKHEMQCLFHAWKSKGVCIALIGAAHMANSFINYYDLGSYIKYIIDDNPNVNGLYFPGCKIQVCDSSVLDDVNIDILLSTISELGEEKLKRSHGDHLNKIEFLSIYAQDNESIYKYLQTETQTVI